MKDDIRSHGLWEASAPAAPPAPPLMGEASADVVVVGGGFTGLSAALHLAEGGACVILLEAVEIGFGGSGRNVGLVNAGMWTMPEELPKVLGDVHGARLLDILGHAPASVFELVGRHGMDCQAVRNGTLHCGVGRQGAEELAERARQWRALGAPVELLDAGETAKRVGTTAYAASLLDRRAGTIQPLAYARGLAHAAVKAGARLHAGSPVTHVEDLGECWRVHTGGGSAAARWVVVATNAYTVLPWRKIRRELVQLPYFNMATRPLDEARRRTILPGREGVWDTREVLSSFRFDAAGRLVFGSVGALRGTGLAVHRGWGRRALARLFPALKGVPFEYEWYGAIGLTADNLPRFHRLARKTVGFCGYNGRGIAPGTVFGRELARLVLGEISEEDLPLPVTDPKPVRLRSLREAYYEWGAQCAHMADGRF